MSDSLVGIIPLSKASKDMRPANVSEESVPPGLRKFSNFAIAPLDFAKSLH